MKILHLVDDWVFTDGPVEAFRGIDVESRFVVLRGNDDKTRYKVKSCDVEIVQIGSREYDELLDSKKWDLVWVYNLTSEKARFVLALGKDVPVIWSVYGIDYVRYSGHWLYGLRTTLLFLKFAPIKTTIMTIVAYCAGKLGISRFLPRLECKFFKRVNYFSCVVPEEESWIRGAVGWRSSVKAMKFHFCSNKSSKSFLYPLVDLSVKRLWVGNSATLTNNHLEILSAIKKVDLKGEYSILTPLSYSYDVSHGELVSLVTDVGRHYFLDRFIPITEMMPFNEYVKLMSSCAIFVFGVRRQQSAGNIITALRCGGCVFLDRRNPVYEHYRKMGVIVYPLEKMKDGFCKVVEEFMPHQKRNVEILSQKCNFQCFLADIKETVDSLKNDICGVNH